MKICFISRQCFLVDNKSGGHVYSESIYKLLCSIAGEKNVELMFIAQSNRMTKVIEDNHIHIKRTTNNKILKRIYWFLGRDGYSRCEELSIVRELKNINADYYFFDGSWLGGLSAYLPHEKVIVLYHNIEKELFFESRAIKDRVVDGMEFISTCNNEKLITKKAFCRICLNKRDSELLNRNYNESASIILPIFLTDKYTGTITCSPTHSILFVGSYYKPNVEGLKWFCSRVMPHIKYDLKIVGRNLELIKDELETSNVHVIGSVENLEKFYVEADVVVAPIFSGGGMKVKIAEALMHGKVIVGTKEAFEGYEDSFTCDMHLCNSDKEFIEALTDLYDSLTRNFSENNRASFLKNYSMNSVSELLSNVLTNEKKQKLFENS